MATEGFIRAALLKKKLVSLCCRGSLKRRATRVDQKLIDALLERTLAEASKALSDTQYLSGAGLWVPVVSGASLFAVCLVLGKWLF